MRPEKQALLAELRQSIGDSAFVLLADYRGLSVSRTDDLRRRLRGVNTRFQVVPNRLVRLAARELKRDALEAGLTGPSAMIFGPGDVVQAAKVLRDFAREHEQRPEIKVGMLQGAALTAADVQRLADLPPRAVLLAVLVGTVAAPMTRLASVLHQKLASLLYVLQAVQTKKEQSAAA